MRQREQQGDVPKHGEETVAIEQKILGSFEQLHFESHMPGTNDLVPIPDQGDADGIDPQGQQSQHSETPSESNGFDHSPSSQRVQQASKTRARCTDAVRERPLGCKPLWWDSDRSDKQETHADTKGEPLT